MFTDALNITAGGSIINTDVSVVSASSISMTAGGGIDLRSQPLDVLSTSGGSLTLKAGTAILLPDSPITTSGGALSIEAAGQVQLPKGENTSVNTSGGAIAITGGSIVLPDVLTSAPESGTSGNITILSSGEIQGLGSKIDTKSSGTSGSILLKSGDTIDLTGGAITSGGAFIRMRADGNVQLPQTLSSSGAEDSDAGNIAVVSRQSIIGNNTSVEASSKSGNGGSVIFVAGAQPGFESLSSLNIHGGSGLASTIAVNSVDTSGTTGGTINLVSFGGGISGSTITSKGGGNVHVIGAGPIEVGSVNTSGGAVKANPFAPGSGNINLLASNPTIYADKDNSLITAGVFVINGDLLGGFSDRTLSPPPGFVHPPGTLVTGNLFLNSSGSAPAGASLKVNDISTAGGQVFLRAGSSIDVKGNINSFAESSQSAVRIMQHFGNGLPDAPGINVADVTGYQISIESNGGLTAGNLSSIGGGTGLTVNTSNALVVGSGSVQLVTNIGKGNSITNGISLWNRTGDVVVNQALDQSTISVTNGRPSVSITASNGSILVPGTINLVSEQRGGDILLSSPTINFNGAAHLSVNGANNNDGGDVSIFSDVLNAPSITIDANGDGEGWGGFVYAERFNTNSIDLSSSFIANAKGGDSAGGGGNVWLFGAKSAPGAILQAHADAGTGGDGGYIYIDSSFDSEGTLTISQTGALTATGGGTAAGAGGSVEIYTGAALSVVGKAVSVNSGLTGGNGGYVGLYAGIGGTGALTITGDIKADGAGDGAGGSIYLSAPTTIASAGGTSRISANGGTTGDGGIVNLTTDQKGGHLTLGGAGSSFLLSADGGSAGSSQGSGGAIEVFAGGDLTINGGNAFHVRALGDSGEGGSLSLIAGYRSTSFEYDPESGQFVNVYQISDSENLNLNAGTLAVRGSGSGTGGSVKLLAANVGLQDSTTLAADGGTSGNGGILKVASTVGDTVLGMSTKLLARGGTSSGEGGDVSVSSAANIVMDGTNINASSRGEGDGGKIKLVAEIDLSNLPGGSVNASAGSTGNGGEITIKGSGAIQVAGSVTSQGGSISGDGGKITIENGGESSTLTGSVRADSRSNGNGGTIDIIIHNSNAKPLSELSLDGPISVIGLGDGLGGTINIVAGGKTPLAIVSSATISSKSEIDDGRIIIKNLEQFLTVNVSGKISGELKLEAQDVMLHSTSENQHLTLGDSSASSGNFKITAIGTNSVIELVPIASIEAKAPVGLSQNNIVLQATNDIKTGDGSRIVVAGISDNQDGGGITVESSLGTVALNGRISADAKGSGDGGQLSVSGQKVNLLGLLATANAGTEGNGGTISIRANGGLVKLDALSSLVANGHGNGNGGTVDLQYSSEKNLKLDGVVSANATGTGNSGDVNVKNMADSDLHVTINGAVSATSVSGTNASITWLVNDITKNSVKLEVGETGSLSGLNNSEAKVIRIEDNSIKSTIKLGQVTATAGGITVKNQRDESIVEFANGSVVKATENISLESQVVKFGNSVSLTGAKIFFSSEKSLSVEMPTQSTVSLNAEGTISFVVSGDISLKHTGNTQTQVNFNSPNVRFTTSKNGNIVVDPGMVIGTPNKLFFAADHGNITVNSPISAKQLINLAIFNDDHSNNVYFIETGADVSTTGTDGRDSINVRPAGGIVRQTAGKIRTTSLLFDANSIGTESVPIKMSVSNVVATISDRENLPPGIGFFMDNDKALAISHMPQFHVPLDALGMKSDSQIQISAEGALNVKYSIISGGDIKLTSRSAGVIIDENARIGNDLAAQDGLISIEAKSPIEIAGRIIANGKISLNSQNNISLKASTLTATDSIVILGGGTTVDLGSAHLRAKNLVQIGVAPAENAISNPLPSFLSLTSGTVGTDVILLGTIQGTGTSILSALNSCCSERSILLNAGGGTIKFGNNAEIVTGISFSTQRPQLQHSCNRLADVFHDGTSSFGHNEKLISIGDGFVVTASKQNTLTQIGTVLSVLSKPGSVIYAGYSNGIAVVRNLCSPNWNTVKIKIGNESLKLSPGQEIIVSSSGKNDDIAKRRLRDLKTIDGKNIRLSEYSYVSALAKDPLLKQLTKYGDKNINRAIMKTAAAIATALQSHGSYKD